MNVNEKGDNVKGTQRGFSQDILHGHEQRWGEQMSCIFCILTEESIFGSAARRPMRCCRNTLFQARHNKIMSETRAQQVIIHPVILNSNKTV